MVRKHTKNDALEEKITRVVRKEISPLVATQKQLKSSIGFLDTKIGKVEESLNNKIDHVEESLNNKIDHVEESLNSKIDHVEESLNSKIDHVENNLNSKIDGAVEALNNKIEHVDKKLDRNVYELGEKIDNLTKMNVEMDKKFDTLITNMDEFIGRIDSEETERKSGYRLLERRIEKLEEKVL